MRRIAMLLFVFWSIGTKAQDPNAKVTDVKAKYTKVMIIPFDPEMYFSDADEALAKYNKKSIKEVRTMFRYGLNVNLNARILSEYGTRALLTDTAKGALEDLYAIYKSISYFQDKSMPTPELEPEYAKEEHKKLFKKTTAEKEDENAHTTSRLKKNNEQNEYINVKIHDVRMLAYLKKKYGTDLFVFVNQLNLVTDYEHCLDRSTNTFERDIKIHFSIFDYTGKQLAGDVAIAHYSSNSNDLIEMMRSNFPIISDYLVANLPKRVKPSQYEEDMKYLQDLKDLKEY